MACHIMRCKTCNRFTMHNPCKECKTETILCIPAKYSPDDPYGRYRREAKKDMLTKEGLL